MGSLCAPFTSSVRPPLSERRSLLSNQWRQTYSRHKRVPSRNQASAGDGRRQAKTQGKGKAKEKKKEGDKYGEEYKPPPPVARSMREQAKEETPANVSDKIKKAAKTAFDHGKTLYNKIYYGDVMPPVGSFQISYAQFINLLNTRRVKRIMLLAEGRLAVVEVPVENTESHFGTVKYDRRDLRVQYAEENEEWLMEKNRYYCELPGDVWEEGLLMRLIKSNQEKRVFRDGKLWVPNESVLRINQVRPELDVFDSQSRAVILSQYGQQFLPILGLVLLRGVLALGQRLFKPYLKEKKSEEEVLAEKYGKHKAKEYNVPMGRAKGDAKLQRDTGVRYKDVAGIEGIKTDIQEVLDILLGKEEYVDMGARPFRGVLMEGPPGTGKTLLAKAMAGEGGLPFFSTNGSEFVEMFQGVAAARVRSLFAAARKVAPSIVFIDEIDAIGKARGETGDSGSSEREQGLLQLLAEMDGAVRDDKVLVIGATNRADALDAALLRAGRFDRCVRLGLPSRPNRLKILQVHAEQKPVDRSDDDAALKRVSELTVGYSGAALANLLNEAAILSVRKESPAITLDVILEAKRKIELGLPRASLPDSAAKRRIAAAQAARGVALALTPGVPPMVEVSLAPRGAHGAPRVVFDGQDMGRDGGTFLSLVRGETIRRVNAVKLDAEPSAFDLACGLMVPLYAARAAEVALWGEEAASLATGREMGLATEIARWIVVDSMVHPAYRNGVVLSNLRLGGQHDPTTAWMDELHDDAILALQKAAAARAKLLVCQRLPVIEIVARELCERQDETVQASRIVELLDSTPIVGPQDGVTDLQREALAAAGGVLGASQLGHSDVRGLVELIMGKCEGWDYLERGVVLEKAAAARDALNDEERAARLAAMRRWVDSQGEAALPPPPQNPVFRRPSHGLGPQIPADVMRG